MTQDTAPPITHGTATRPVRVCHGSTAWTPPPRPPSRHGPVAQLLIAWSPLSAVLVGYVIAQWVAGPLADGAPTNRWGLPLHVAGPAAADRWLFGVLPTHWLQERLLGGGPRWYDAVASLVYVTHLLTLPLVTALAWFRLRARFTAWVLAVLTLTLTGYLGYVAYPAAPPWWASEQGAVGQVERTSHAGWDVLHLDAVGRLTTVGQDGSNPVAAMPSLHAGVALLVALFLWPAASAVGRGLLALYAVAMGLTLVYTGEHYVVDVLAGWALAVLALLVGVRVAAAARRWRAPRAPSRPGRTASRAAGSPTSARRRSS